jgi:microcystin degradation protein MlrC
LRRKKGFAMTSNRYTPCVAIAGFQLESVSFLPNPSTLADFESVALRGEKIIQELRGTNTVIGGFVKVCEQADIKMLPIVQTAIGAAGPATDEAVEAYTNEIAEGIEAAAGQLDGVLLFLHGACWSPSHPDPERFILARVRAALGPDKPLVLAMDYHGNIDADTLENTTAAFAYRKSPHIDAGETGERAADCMRRILNHEIHPAIVLAKPGVLVPSIFSATSLEPLSGIIAKAARIQAASPTYLDITVMAGFSYTDAHNTGFAVLCSADDASQAQKAADELSSDIHGQRQALYRPVPVHSVADALDYTADQLDEFKSQGGKHKPFVLLEHADRVNDSTYVLAAMLERGMRNAAMPFLWDSAAAQAAAQAGAGHDVELELGAHSSDKAGPRLHVKAKVLWAGPKKFCNTGTYMHGLPIDLGLTALLDINGIMVSVTSTSHTAVNGDPFYIFDQKPEDFDIIVLRSKTHFRAFYEPVAHEILIVDTPDHGPADLTLLPYRHLDTASVFPFNDR